jgi:hypothetical protein
MADDSRHLWSETGLSQPAAADAGEKQQQQQQSAEAEDSDHTELDDPEQMHSETSFVPTVSNVVAQADALQMPPLPAAQPQSETAAAVPASTGPTQGPHDTAAASPSKLTYSELQVRCQLLEAALEQQQQSSSAALSATLAAHAAEEASLRAYYESQLTELMDRLADVHSASAEHSAAALPQAAAEASAQAAGAAESPAASPNRQGATDAAAAAGPYTNLDSRPASAAARAAAAGRPPSPGFMTRSSRSVALLLASPAAAAGVGSGAAAAAAADEAVLLRRELVSAESLLQSSQEENRAAAKRIKVGRLGGACFLNGLQLLLCPVPCCVNTWH